MIKVGLLYDSVSNNTGDKAIGISLMEFCERHDFDYEVVDPFNVDARRYSTLLIGGGHIIRERGDEFYDNFRVPGNHVLVAAGLTTDQDLEYLNEYQFVSVRSQREYEMIKGVVDKAEILPCTSLLLENDDYEVPEAIQGSVGVHLTHSTLANCPDIPRAVSKIPTHKAKIFIPFTHYNKDRSFMKSLKLQREDDILLSEMNPKELFSIIGSLDYMITSSLHATMFAYVNNVPMAAAYQPKIYDFLKDRGLQRLVFKNTEELVDCIGILENDDFDFRKIIEEDRAQVSAGLNDIKEIIKSNDVSIKNENPKTESVLNPEWLETEQLKEVVKGRDSTLEHLINYQNSLREELSWHRAIGQQLQDKNQRLENELSVIKGQLNMINQSKGWRMIKLVRKIRAKLTNMLTGGDNEK